MEETTTEYVDVNEYTRIAAMDFNPTGREGRIHGKFS